jgi:hypothetical protein
MRKRTGLKFQWRLILRLKYKNILSLWSHLPIAELNKIFLCWKNTAFFRTITNSSLFVFVILFLIFFSLISQHLLFPFPLSCNPSS